MVFWQVRSGSRGWLHGWASWRLGLPLIDWRAVAWSVVVESVMVAAPVLGFVSLDQESVIFAALAVALAAGAAWRWTHPEDHLAAEASRAGLWLLVVSAASLVIQLAGFV